MIGRGDGGRAAAWGLTDEMRSQAPSRSRVMSGSTTSTDGAQIEAKGGKALMRR